MTRTDLSPISRASGGFAMLAVDQREALRNMLSESTASPVSDDDVRDFKLEATEVLSPFASAVLLDRQFVLDQAIEGGVVAEGCGLIAAADSFESAYGELVGRVTIDDHVEPVAYRDRGVVALKLLVIYRPDEASDDRVSMVDDFVSRCRDAGVISIIEPVSRAPRDGGAFDWNQGVIEAARELGSLGADLYKAEVPHRAAEPEDIVRRSCASLSQHISSPWVVLSSGVDPNTFPTAVRWAMQEGASGFLAGRAVWSSSLGAADRSASLRTDAVDRLQKLSDVVDELIAQ